jgi:hypothetical protein
MENLPWHTTPHASKIYDRNGDPVILSLHHSLIVAAVNTYAEAKAFLNDQSEDSYVAFRRATLGKEPSL